jgi:hypothetical protein
MNYRATKFSAAEAKRTLGPDPVENTPKGTAAAFVKILIAQGFEVNEPEILRWCEYQFKRRYCLGRIPPGTVTVDTIVTQFRVYMQNWYSTHAKWQRANS